VTTEPSDRIEELVEPQQERQPASEVGSPTKETTKAAQKEGD
jgi:hypothetical protein